MAAVQEQNRLLKRLNITVIASSPDAEAGAREMVSSEKLDFAVGYGMDQQMMDDVHAIPGERNGELIVQPAEFIIKPGGEIAASVYATTQLGRMSPREIAVFVKDRS